HAHVSPPSQQPQAQAWASNIPPQAQRKGGVPAWAWIVGAVVLGLVVLYMIGTASNQQQAQQQQAAYGATTPGAQPQQAAGEANQYQQQVFAKLAQAQQSFLSQGFQQIGQNSSGNLAQGQYQNIPVQLTSAGDYRIVGVCDDDCGDLDLSL